MKISSVKATPLAVPLALEISGKKREKLLSCTVVEVETDSGLSGHGFTCITEEEVIAAAINQVCAPHILGLDPLAHEAVWDRLYWLLSPRGQTGYASHAMAAIDVALWDIKGKALNQPVWRLLGGARDRVAAYATFGFDMMSRDELAEAARRKVAEGFGHLKMTVGHEAWQRRDTGRMPLAVLREDIQRVRTVREAVGPDVRLSLDANCSFDPEHATLLARSVAEYDIAFFEEPITQNDARQMALLRRQVPVPLAAGQNEGLLWRFRDLLVEQAVDVLQPNVVINGGFTQGIRIAAMAAGFNVPIANGGNFAAHNMHLHGGLANGGLVEWHTAGALLTGTIYPDAPQPKDGFLHLSDKPGLGLTPDKARIADLARLPLSRGMTK